LLETHSIHSDDTQLAFRPHAQKIPYATKLERNLNHLNPNAQQQLYLFELLEPYLHKFS